MQNPFLNRGPIQDPHFFFGRQRETRLVLGLLSQMQNCAIIGPLKVGKTSFLFHLTRPSTWQEHDSNPDPYLPVYLTFEGLLDRRPEELFYVFWRETLSQARSRLDLASQAPLEPEGSLSFLTFGENLEELERNGLNLLYLLDEFDLSVASQHLDLNFFSALRSLASRAGIAFVVASQVELHKLEKADRQVGSPFADLFTPIRLGLLERAEAAALVTQLSSRAGLSLEKEMDFILEITAGHPFFAQVLCASLFELMREHEELSPALRDYAVAELLTRSRPMLEATWERFAADARRALIEISQTGLVPQNDNLVSELAAEGLILQYGDVYRLSSPVWERFVEARVRETSNGDEILRVAEKADWREANQILLPENKELLYSVVRSLVKTIEARDPYARDHADRTAKLAVAIARELGLGESDTEGLKIAARLHDLGHIAISDLILLKPGPLTTREREIMQTHPIVGAQILEALEFPWPVRPAVRLHHERWDGSGYPEGLIGEEIPLVARILGVADTYCAMTDPRPWRPALTHDEAVTELEQNAAITYDPVVVAGCLRALENSSF